MKELMIVTLVFVASIHCSAIKSEQSHHEHAKSGKEHMGFFVSLNKLPIISLIITYSTFISSKNKKGSRGKRSVNSDNIGLESTESGAHEGDLKEWPMLRESLYNFERNARAPKGFYGLRGKKDFRSGEGKRALLGIQQVKQATEASKSMH
jgi:hypothetical protein